MSGLPPPDSASLSSSLSSSVGSSMLRDTPRPANSSQSDIMTSDRSVASLAGTSPSSKNRFFPISISSSSRSTARMGQGGSRPSPASPPAPSTPLSSYSTPLPLAAPTSGPGSRLKRVWRRKKSEDVTSIHSQNSKGKERDRRPSVASSAFTTTPASSVENLEVLPPTISQSLPGRTKSSIHKQLTAPFSVFAQKKNGPVTKHANSSDILTPASTPALRPTPLPSSKGSPTSPENRISVIPTTPGISAAIQFLHSQDAESLAVVTRDKPDAETKRDWRRSDSTMMSYTTIRPGALAGNRSPRPVSLAESSHSGHTIVPANKRLSALITDAEFAMAEEGDSDSEIVDVSRFTITSKPSPAPSVKARNRRSSSLSPGFGKSKPSTPEPSSPPTSESFVSLSGYPRAVDGARLSPTTSRDAPALTRTAARGIIAPLIAPGASDPTASNIRGRLAVWSANNTAPPSSERVLSSTLTPPVPQPQRRPQPSNSPAASNISFRQTAVSITGGLAPAALGIGRRAAEKVHRVFGGLSSSSSTHSGWSSTSSLSATSGAPSSYTSSGKYSEYALGRSSSNQSIPSTAPGAWKPKRRTPNAPSGSWSVSSTSTSDSSSAAPGPYLGTCLRGPKTNNSGAAFIKGVVFGRELRACVQDTAIDSIRLQLSAPSADSGAMTPKAVEERMLPALVVRCVQHLMQWGIQEEGLFRINGRNAHVAKLRAEFDTGADYNLAECDPGDLDPHAVASIFKAYLRELPESLLTTALIPLFEAALDADKDSSPELEVVPTVPASPFFGIQGSTTMIGIGAPLTLRKPPSLSTLAMPTFAGVRTVSETTVVALAGLIAQLPRENRDLLYTVVELIQATADRLKETRMNLGNLLLMFCPGLNMSPSLLRVLCESRGIWDGTAKLSAIPGPASEPDVPALEVIPASATPDEPVQLGVIQADESSGSESDNDSSDAPVVRPRSGTRRGPIKTMLYAPAMRDSPPSSNNSGSGQDDAASYLSALENLSPMSHSPNSPGSPSPTCDSSSNLPALSRSTDSLATPSTMSEVSSLQQTSPISPSDGGKVEEGDLSSGDVPAIASVVDLSLPPSIRQGPVTASVPFPSTGANTSPSPLARKKSLGVLSFPPLSKTEGSSETSPSKRSKRPSLHLLFSRKSSTSLRSPSPLSPHSAPGFAPPEISRLPVVETPTSCIPSMPPVLETSISSSPIDVFDLAGRMESVAAAFSGPSSSIQRERKDSEASSLFATPEQTPVADHYRSRNASLLRGQTAQVVTPLASETITVKKMPSQSSIAPSIIDIGIEGAMENDWAQSVLDEAQVKSVSSKSRWSTMRLFER